jgi:hypothetical protein
MTEVAAVVLQSRRGYNAYNNWKSRKLFDRFSDRTFAEFLFRTRLPTPFRAHPSPLPSTMNYLQTASFHREQLRSDSADESTSVHMFHTIPFFSEWSNAITKQAHNSSP